MTIWTKKKKRKKEKVEWAPSIEDIGISFC